jgi:hypothetical protein
MNLNELNTLFDAACNAQQRANSEDVSLWSCRGVGLKAVVEALRDAYTSTGYRMMTNHHFDEILASDGVEAPAIRAAAGGGE